jgi:hypothetical protein
MLFDHILTRAVLEDMEKQSVELNGKIKKYLEILDEKGHSLAGPFVDKIEGYKNLWELRPHHHNIEYRMIFFWQKNTAYFMHAFVEKGQKKKNRREYDTADRIKQELLKILLKGEKK